MRLGGVDALMGNGALAEAEMPSCPLKGNTAQVCGDQLEEEIAKTIGGVVGEIHESSSSTRVVGFGYDVMFGGLGCDLVAKNIFPQCWKNKTVNSIECFNISTANFSDCRKGWKKSRRPEIVPT